MAATQAAATAQATARRPRRVHLTMRQDAWWVPSLLTFLGLSSFIVYATWAAFQNAHYAYGNYLSPFYSPELFGDSPHAWFGPKPSWFPDFLPFSPALLILWAPAGFRFTCYYYRGAYYKAFWADPPGCAVGEPRKSYLGENSFPLIIQNIHRYFLYLALLFLVFLAYDAWKALWFVDPNTGARDARSRRRHPGDRGERRVSRLLHARLPLAAPPGRRPQGRARQGARCAPSATTA